MKMLEQCRQVMLQLHLIAYKGATYMRDLMVVQLCYIDTLFVAFRDARIAALEQSSVETEKIIADARHERLQHLEEVYQANRKVAELEAQ